VLTLKELQITAEFCPCSDGLRTLGHGLWHKRSGKHYDDALQSIFYEWRADCAPILPNNQEDIVDLVPVGGEYARDVN
jgi:hypothetical protein